MTKYNIAIVGATGNVGREIITNLEEMEFPVASLIPVASDRSIGNKISFKDNTLDVMGLTEIDFGNIDIAFFCAGSEISKKYARLAADRGCIVIDKSSYFRLNDDVPLVVPEVNIDTIKGFKSGIIANPNCCSIPLAVALKPLDNAARLKRLVISTYQSVSGAGKAAMDELYTQTKAKFIYENIAPKALPHKIAFNLFPHIGDFRDDGYTDEEYKIAEELKKIIGKHIKVTATCVRVPVFISHCISVNAEFEKPITAREAEELLYEADGVTVYSQGNEIKYATPVDIVRYSEVFVSRIRDDFSSKNTINLWVATDNLQKGAALNALQIARELISQ